MRLESICRSVALAMALSGCWLSALQMAPLATHAIGDVGSGALTTAAGTAAARHGDDSAKYVAELDSPEETCREFVQIESPLVMEFKTDEAGATRYRELTLVGSAQSLRWAAGAKRRTDAAGWRQATDLDQWGFDPPLKKALSPGATCYIAYAPTEVRGPADSNRQIALVREFGPTLGSFRYKGRVYEYAVVRQLPCFPAPN